MTVEINKWIPEQITTIWTPSCGWTAHPVHWNHWINYYSTCTSQAFGVVGLGSKGLTRFRSGSLFTESTACHGFTLHFAAWSRTNEWMNLSPSRPAWGPTESYPLTIIYEAVCFLKLTRCCLLALLVQRITECFIQYLSKSAAVTYKWCQICLPKTASKKRWQLIKSYF